MATHITCHANGCLPNQFPPPRPTAHCHGMLSDYEKGHVMSQSVPMIKTNVEGGTTFPNDDDIEPLPMYRITPVVYDRRGVTCLTDPDLCITPEKLTPIKKKRINRERTLPEPGSSKLRTTKVRFDQTVTVKHLSPEGGERSDIIEIDRADDTDRELSFRFDDEIPFGEHSESEDDSAETFPKTYSYAIDESVDYEDQMQSIMTQTNGLIIGSKANPMDERGTFTNVAGSKPHGMMRRKIAKCSPEKQQWKNSADTLGSDVIIEVKAQKMASAKTSLVEDGGAVEHVLARPEFNSTLFMSKEVQEMENQEVDLPSAVAERLKKSDKMRTKLDENTYAVLNRGGGQFSEVFSVDVQEDDLIDMAAQEKGAKMEPTHKRRTHKPEDCLSHAPDIMEFFTPDLQRETPSFSLPHITMPPNRLLSADPLSAFDTYSHIRAWEEW